MPVKESSATALVRFTGLGIVCFNREQRRGEIAAIRDDRHALSIRIQRPVFRDGAENDLVVYQDVAAYQNLPKQGVRVEIKAAGAGASEGYEIYQRGQFDRLNAADPNDFRWVVNIDSEHGGASLRPTGAGRHPLTKIYVGGGLFYTHKLDTDLFFEKVERDAAGAALRREAFGNVAETVGVRMEGAEVVFSISFGGREETHALPRVEGLPYRVEFKNMDYSADAVYSDMADYYCYLSSPAGNCFDLSPVSEDDESGGGSVNQKQFCHPVASDISSIDDL
jgi:hypothetical protein